jgi:hypothetical protein
MYATSEIQRHTGSEFRQGCPKSDQSFGSQSRNSHPLLPSMNKMRYDASAYAVDISQSRGAGNYFLETPMPHCQPCFANDPRLQFGTSGHSECMGRALVDIDSELIGITRKASRAPMCKHQPPQGPSDICPLVHVPDCTTKVLAVQDTRLNNPPQTLRCTGWNRWEWLCNDPQEHAIMQFDTGIDTSIVTKDNHRPLITTPLDQTVFLPPRKYESPDHSAPKWKPKRCDEQGGPAYDPNAFTSPIPVLHWKTCDENKRIQNGCSV